MRTAVFINTHSRGGRTHLKAVRRYFEKSKQFELIAFIVVEELDEIDSCIRQLKNVDQLECVIIGSGDGTIVTVLNALKNRKDIVYGILPLGTGNIFAKSIGLPADSSKVLKMLPKLEPTSISLGMVNGRLFANTASLGVPTHVVVNLTNKTKKWLGIFAYAVSGLKALRHHNAFLCEAKTDDGIYRFYTHHLIVANGTYHGPLPIDREASVHNDKLVMAALGTSSSRRQYLRSLVTFGLGRHTLDKNFLIIPTETLEIRTQPIRRIETDGELLGKTPAKFKVVKQAIRVLSAPPKPARVRKRRSIRRPRN